MAKSRRKKQQAVENDEVLVDISETTDKVTDFFEKNQKTILGFVFGLLIGVGGYFAYKNLVMKPKEERAVAEIYQAEMQFARDSFAQALTNPGGGFLGFIDIIDEYSGTTTANTASYYAGISYLNLGDFEEAVDYLESFSTSDNTLSIMKYGALGDAYSELGDLDAALKNYKKASSMDPIAAVSALYLEKLALLEMKNGNKEEAKKHLTRIKSEFPSSSVYKDVDKYMSLLN